MDSSKNPADQSKPSKPPVKVRLHGFTELHSGGPDPIADIVFVHGIQGHPKTTWTYLYGATSDPAAAVKKPSFLKKILPKHKKAESSNSQATSIQETAEYEGCFWPEQLLAADFPNCRILTFGYDSHVSHFFSGPAIQSGIIEYGTELLTGLAAQRRDNTPGPKKLWTRKIIFIAHSMGGLIVKEALRRAKGAVEEHQHLRNIYDCTFAIMFFSTPHKGSTYANLGLFAEQLAAASGISTNDANLRNLKPNAEYPRMLSEEFTKILDSSRIWINTFQESKGYGKFGPLREEIVKPDSSSLDYVLEVKAQIKANHVDMCRFYGQEDDGYIKTKQALDLHIDRIPIENAKAALSEAKLREKLCLKSLDIRVMNLRQEAVNPHFQYIDSKGRIKRPVETQQWLWDDSEKGPGLAPWLRDGYGIFWVQGKPGSGKSTVMKHLWESSQTLKLLTPTSNEINNSNPWLKICAFFHDRGDSVQKSLTGVLSKLIHQIIIEHRELIQLIVPIGLRDRQTTGASMRPSLDTQDAGDHEAPWQENKQHIQFDWSFSSLRLAFLKIVSQTEISLNILALVDALDEHEVGTPGSISHLEMIQFFEELVKATSPVVRLKMIVSSRPETVFKDTLGEKAGFSVETYTRPDIDDYIQCTLGVELGVHPLNKRLTRSRSPSRTTTPPRSERPSVDLTSEFSRNEDRNTLQIPLTDRSRNASPSSCAPIQNPEEELMIKIASEAQGVFLWVELVVKELLKEWRKKRFISALTKKLAEMPQELKELYKYILRRISAQDRKAALITMELILRSRRNLSLLELSLMVEYFEDVENNEGFLIFLREILRRIKAGADSRNRLGIDLYRILQDRSHGLLEVEGAILDTRPDDTHTKLGINSMSQRLIKNRESSRSTTESTFEDPTENETTSSIEDSGESTSVFDDFGNTSTPHRPKYLRTVQFLHQTAKEYVADSQILQNVFDNELNQIQKFQGGEMMFLSYCLYWLRAPQPERDSIEGIILYDARIEVPLYAPLIEKPTKLSSTELLSQKESITTHLLNDLDQEIRKTYGEFWLIREFGSPISGIESKTNFLSFAVHANMRSYVAETLNQYPHLIKKPGQPLLHYAIYPVCLPEMVEDLLARRIDIHEVFRPRKGPNITAIQSISFWNDKYDEMGEPILTVIRSLIAHGANPNLLRTSDGFPDSPLLYQVSTMKIVYDIKFGMLEMLKAAGAKMDFKPNSGFTTLELISYEESGFSTSLERNRMILWLLEAGAKITTRMDKYRERYEYFPWDNEEFTKKEYFARSIFWRRLGIK